MTDLTMARPIEILLIEDNPGDIRLTQEGLAESKVCNNLHVVEDGVEALQFLRQESPFDQKPRPDLIMLDLNLPRMDGREVLARIKTDSDLKRIPVVVLTTSEAEEDVLRAYDLHANCYITKPVVFEKFLIVVRTIENFWFSIVQLPEK